MQTRFTSIFTRAAVTLLMMLLTSMTQRAWAQSEITSGTCGAKATDNVSWAVTDTDDDGSYDKLTISGSGAMKNYFNDTPAPWAAFKSDLTTAVIGDGVTNIGKNAFYSHTALTSVSIASSVTRIGMSAFKGCNSLANINGASGVTFIEPYALNETAWRINLPDGMNCVGHVAYRFVGDGTSATITVGTTQINENCFLNSKITSIVIPASVTSIGNMAFKGCTDLSKVYVLRNGASDNEITSLGSNAFENCTKLTAIIVPADAYDNNYYSGSWNSYESILKPGYTVTGTNITATTDGPLVQEGEEVTLIAPTDYTIISASYNDGSEDHEITPVNDVWSFTMPAHDVTVTATWKKLLTNTDIIVEAIDDQTWNDGNAITPAVIVKDGTTDISGECDFAYSNNQNTGTATVTITAKATSTGYTGSTTTTFKIVPIVVLKSGAVEILEDQNGRHAIIDGNYSGSDAINLKEDVEVADVTFNRTFPTDGYSTIVLPFSVKTSELCGVDSVLSFAGIVEENGMWECAMQVVWEETLETVDLQAYTPYIVRTNRSNISITGPVTFERTRDAFDEKGDWEIRGATAYTVWDATHNNTDLGRVYGFAATAVAGDKIEIGDFVRAEAGAYIYPLRCYLYYRGSDSDSNQSQARRRAPSIDELPDRIPVRIVNNDSETMEIKATDFTDYTDKAGAWYSLDGRQLDKMPTAKGIYIHGNRKVAIK